MGLNFASRQMSHSSTLTWHCWVVSSGTKACLLGLKKANPEGAPPAAERPLEISRNLLHSPALLLISFSFISVIPKDASSGEPLPVSPGWYQAREMNMDAQRAWETVQGCTVLTY